MKRILFGLFVMGMLPACQEQAPSPIPAESRQLLLMLTPHAEAVQGKLLRFERSSSENEWRFIGNEIPVAIGRKGLGWGKGLHSDIQKSLPEKREGDGRSPAGVFRLMEVYGVNDPDNMAELKMPYRQLTSHTECVDDVKSQHYNRIVERTDISEVDWNSSEKMHRIMPEYELGVVVGHNMPDVENGAGCCIFLHIWGGPDVGTAGCTTMSAQDMHDVAFWLDVTKAPVIVQLTKKLYEDLDAKWQLPNAGEKR